MELRARIDFSGSVRFDVRGGDTAAVAEEAAARAGALRLLFLLEGEDGRPLRVSGPLRLLDHGRLVIEDIRPDGKEKDG